MCTTRFRNNVKLAIWGEKDDRCLYLFARKLKEDIESGEHKVITETEHFILKEYLSNYVYIRLTNMFLIDVSDPIVYMIDFFESSSPRIQERFDRMYQFFFTIIGKFVKNAANLQTKSLSAILAMDFSDPSLHLEAKNIFLGSKVDLFLREMNLTRDSKEIVPWLHSVMEFYMELTKKMIKYFKPSLLSRSLQDLDILNPMAIFSCKIDELKSKYKYVGKKFSNIVKSHEIPSLLEQVTQMYVDKKIQSYAKESSSEEFFSGLCRYDDGRYLLVGKLGCALLTVENSGSPAERDFTLLNFFLADPRTANTKQLRMKARLFNKSYNNNLRYECNSCEINEVEKRKFEKIKFEAMLEEMDGEVDNGSDDNEDTTSNKKDTTHCHCKLFEVSQPLLASMKDGQPWRRYKEEDIKKRQLKEADKAERERARLGDDKRKEEDLKEELRTLRRKLRETDSKRANKVKKLILHLKEILIVFR